MNRFNANKRLESIQSLYQNAYDLTDQIILHLHDEELSGLKRMLDKRLHYFQKIEKLTSELTNISYQPDPQTVSLTSNNRKIIYSIMQKDKIIGKKLSGMMDNTSHQLKKLRERRKHIRAYQPYHKKQIPIINQKG